MTRHQEVHSKHAEKRTEKPPEKPEKHIEKKGPDYFMFATIILAVLLIISVFTSGFGLGSKSGSLGQALSANDAADKSIKFINQNLVQSGNAALKNVVEDKGIYKMTMTIDGKEYDTYVTKDGTMLFPSAVDMSQASAQGQNQKNQQNQQNQQQPQANLPKSDKPKSLLFTMSYCPYGNIAEDGMQPAVQLLGSAIDFEPHYVIYQNYGGGGPDYCLENGKYCSLHGIQELRQDVRELCMWKYENAKFWTFIKAANSQCNYQNIDSCWEGVAKTAGMDTAKIKSCFDTEKIALLDAEVKLNEQYGVQGSPTLIVNGGEYQGGRSPEDYKLALCGAMNTAASECSTVLSATSAQASGGCGT